MGTTPKLTKVMDREFLGSKCQLASAPDTCGATNNCGNAKLFVAFTQNTCTVTNNCGNTKLFDAFTQNT